MDAYASCARVELQLFYQMHGLEDEKVFRRSQRKVEFPARVSSTRLLAGKVAES